MQQVTDACGAVDQEAFESAIRDNMSPEGVAATVAFLRICPGYHMTNPAGEQAKRQVEWLANTLVEMLGADEYNRLLETIGL